MKILSIREIIRAIGGILLQGKNEGRVRHAAIHPYQLKDHSVLFDLNKKGHRFGKVFQTYPYTTIVTENGNRFLGREKRMTVIEVRDIEKAFWAFVRYYRSLWDIPVIGVTGTCGKTTVKEMIAHLLAGSIRVNSTYLSKNSLVRNFRYLMEMDEKTEAAVFEMGVACPDDLIHSCNYFQPQIGVITTIGTDHLEHCGSHESYIKEKAKLLIGMKNRGHLILNADNEYIRQIDTSSFKGKLTSFGLHPKADFCASQVKYGDRGMEFILRVREQSYPTFVPGFGEHNVRNALAALAASCATGLKLERAVRRLASFQHVERHLELIKGFNGCTVLDDSWSSNPTSAEAALEVLNQLANKKRKVAVLGRMALLGDYTRSMHEEVGEKVVEEEVDCLITTDDTAEWIANRAIEMGMLQQQIHRCFGVNDVKQVLSGYLDASTIILLKTSMLDPKTEAIKRILMEGK